MNHLAHWLARRVWWGMLWFMRRPWMKRLQRRSIDVWRPGPWRERARRTFRRQERWARRYGLQVLTGVFLTCLMFVAMLAIYTLLSNWVVPYLDLRRPGARA